MVSRSTDSWGSFKVKPFIPNALAVVLDDPVKFRNAGGIAHGYPATVLAELDSGS